LTLPFISVHFPFNSSLSIGLGLCNEQMKQKWSQIIPLVVGVITNHLFTDHFIS
jgi:hypothetical protein